MQKILLLAVVTFLLCGCGKNLCVSVAGQYGEGEKAKSGSGTVCFSEPKTEANKAPTFIDANGQQLEMYSSKTIDGLIRKITFYEDALSGEAQAKTSRLPNVMARGDLVRHLASTPVITSKK